MNPSTEAILQEVNRTPSEIVFILPNNKNIIMAAQQCVGLTEKQVIVVPTATVPQGISAMMAVDPDNDDPQAILAAMTEAAANVTTARDHLRRPQLRLRRLRHQRGRLSGRWCDSQAPGHRPQTWTYCLDKLAHVAAGARTPSSSPSTPARVSTEDEAASAAEVFETICPDAEVAALPGGQPSVPLPDLCGISFQTEGRYLADAGPFSKIF
ncbi:MAG: hypothetical protein ACLUNZ_13940 [Evtepia sp.]